MAGTGALSWKRNIPQPRTSFPEYKPGGVTQKHAQSGFRNQGSGIAHHWFFVLLL